MTARPGGVAVSVIVPVYNRRDDLAQCLAALREQRDVSFEIIVVDDGSTDDSAAVAASFGASVARLPRRYGAAVARNHGARCARGQTLLFVDSDVLVPPSIARRAHDALQTRAEYDAVFGSYDATPQADTVVSAFRNLLHHYTHQVAATEAVTFWAGSGAIRKSVFDEIGGFDTAWESIEDIELGYRLREHGHRIFLDHGMQATHTKRWTLVSMFKTDLRGRAIPWSRLILARGSVPDALNVRFGQRASVALTGVLAVSLVLSLNNAWWLAVAAAAWAAIVLVNRDFYAFLHRRRGLASAIAGPPLHLLYFFTAGLGFAWAWLERAAARVTGRVSVRASTVTPNIAADPAAFELASRGEGGRS